MPIIINCPEVIKSLSDKAKLFAINFALEYKGHPREDFTLSRITSFVISLSGVRELSTLSCVDPTTVTGLWLLLKKT